MTLKRPRPWSQNFRIRYLEYHERYNVRHNGGQIGNHEWAFDWHHDLWHWMTLNSTSPGHQNCTPYIFKKWQQIQTALGKLRVRLNIILYIKFFNFLRFHIRRPESKRHAVLSCNFVSGDRIQSYNSEQHVFWRGTFSSMCQIVSLLTYKYLLFVKKHRTGLLKANRMLGPIIRTIKFENPVTFRNLYKSMVRPHVEYCSVA